MLMGSRVVDRKTGRWLALALVLCVAVPSVITVQGCCSWARKHCRPTCPSSSPFVVVAPNDTGNPCRIYPSLVQVHRGDMVLFVNASSVDITFKLNTTSNVFNEGHEFKVPAGGIECRTVSTNAPLKKYKINMTPDPADFCPGLPGPGMQVNQ